jgi:ABC-type transporter Mla subunit MlaD
MEKKPSIEQRLEAITRNLELLASLQADTERKLDRLIETVDRLSDTVNTGFTKAAAILLRHEERLDEHEARLNELQDPSAN